VAGIALATVAFDFLGILALVGESLLLVIALRVRSSAAAMIVGFGAAIFLILVVRAVSSCDPSIEDCSPDWEGIALIAWLGVLAVAGLIGALYVRRAETP